jgi:dephospho-CoA kinase
MTQGKYRVALTGGIGSGKTVVSDRLALLGAAVIDSDVIARQITAAGGSAMDAIAQTFGGDFLTPDGALDRARMRAHVFADPLARSRLEAITHPLIQQETARVAASSHAMAAPYQVFAIPLLVESGFNREANHRFARVLTVDCAPETQLARVMERSHLDASQAHAIIDAQASRTARLAIADDVLVNEHKSLTELMVEVDALHLHYCQAARGARS